MTAGSFVGREPELATLAAALNGVIGGQSRTLLLFGEGGIGKTRLADELSTRASSLGARVLWGRCWEGGGAPAYWPWLQILRALGSERAEDLGLSSLALRSPDPTSAAHAESPQPPSASWGTTDPDYERFKLFDAASRFLQDASERAPLVLVLDDLHAADVPSLLLFRFLARSPRQVRILALGTCREQELRLRPDAANAVDALAREAQTIVLGGMSVAEVSTLVQAAAGGATPSASLVETVHKTTDGNPFFVNSLIRLLMAERPSALTDASARVDLRLPAHVLDSIRRRLMPLSGDCVRILSLASVIGRDFDLRIVERLSEVDRNRLTQLLEDAANAEVIRPATADTARFGFSHPLIREALYGEIDLPTRTRLHQRIGETLEELYHEDPDAHLAELAHHFVVASSIGDPGKALEYSARAGTRAAEQLAYEEAAVHFGHALQALDRDPSLDESRRFELLLALGETVKAAGKATEAAGWFHEAVESARRLESSAALARSVLSLAGIWVVRTGTRDEALLRLLEESLQALGHQEVALRARLLARLAMELRWAESAERRAALSAEAVALARRIGDPPTLAFALMAKHWALPGPDDVTERLETAAEIVSLAERAHDRPMEIVGRTWRMTALLELGRMPQVHAEIRTIGAIAEEIRLPYYRWWSTGSRAVMALLEGRFDDAEQIANEELQLGQEAEAPDALQCYGLQITMVRREQNRLEEVEGMLQAFVQDIPLVPAWRALLAALYAELGREADARRDLEAFLRDDFESLTRDDYWLPSMTALAEVAASLGHREAAEVLYERLLPYADRNSVVGLTILSNGPVSRDLGLLAITLSRPDEAVKWLEAALHWSQTTGSKAYAVRSQMALAEALRLRARPGDNERAEEMFDAATAEAEALGMKSVLVKGSPEESDRAGGSKTAFVLRREGKLWIVGREGDPPKYLKEMKGLSFLVRLLSNPETSFGALELAAVGKEPPERRAAPSPPAPASENRGRRSAGPGERARVAVTKALRLAITAIEREDPALGRHLNESVRTGRAFSYSPLSSTIRWRL